MLVSQGLNPFVKGDGWSMMSSERSDEKRTEKIVLKSLSRAQGGQWEPKVVGFYRGEAPKWIKMVGLYGKILENPSF